MAWKRFYSLIFKWSTKIAGGGYFFIFIMAISEEYMCRFQLEVWIKSISEKLKNGEQIRGVLLHLK